MAIQFDQLNTLIHNTTIIAPADIFVGNIKLSIVVAVPKWADEVYLV